MRRPPENPFSDSSNLYLHRASILDPPPPSEMAFRCARSLHRLQPLIPRHLHPQSFRCLSRPLLRHRCYSAVVADPSIPAAFIPIPKRQYQPPQPTPDFTPPSCCPGCGAPGQQLDANLPGYYPLKLVQRLRPVEVKKHKKGTPRELERERVAKKKAEEEAYYEALKRVEGNADMIKQLGLTSEDLPTSPDVPQIPKHLIKMDPPTPICNRCHDLKHHHKAVSLPSYPSLKTLTSLLLSSRHKHNHIYHLIDAADFPATLHPGLRNHLHLNLPNSITKNLTVSYIITRTDVLMPQRDQISSLMTYIKSTIKSVLPERETVEGGIHSNCRLYAVSNRTGWDIGKLKEEISKRQGGVWFFGAVNVGKSSLLSSIWPEDGRPRPVSFEDAAEFEILPEESEETIEGEDFKYGAFETVMPKAETEHESLDQILNKAQVKAKPNPDLYVHVPPTVSDVPGTTAAPIRVSYKSVGRGGKYKGEVVDLPGLTRWVGFKESGFMKYVRPEKRSDVIMKQRITPEQYTIKPGTPPSPTLRNSHPTNTSRPIHDHRRPHHADAQNLRNGADEPIHQPPRARRLNLQMPPLPRHPHA